MQKISFDTEILKAIEATLPNGRLPRARPLSTRDEYSLKTSLARCFPERIFIGSDHTGTIRLVTRSLSAYSGLTVH